MKTALLTPLYLSVSWVLTVSYQLFTDTAVKTVAIHVNLLSPAAGAWLNSNIGTIVFVYAFTWIFVLSSVIPSVILGKERSVLIQYFVCLIIAFLAISVKELLLAYGGIQFQELLSGATFLNNPILAGIYLMIPYLVMIGVDIRSRRKKNQSKLKSLTNTEA